MTQFLSGQRFQVEYCVSGTARHAQQIAQRLCLDQTIEGPAEILPPSQDSSALLGRLESFETEGADRHRAVLSFPVELFGNACPQLLHTLFGTASLNPGIQVRELFLPSILPSGWPGPRFGCTGLRVLADVFHRPLVCGVLKPLGCSPAQLADLASQFARGGVDLIKDDQGLGDHQFCRFEERVSRCVEALQRVSQERQRPCLYFPHLTGTPDEIMERARFVQAAGADGVLMCPGLVGYGMVQAVTRDPGFGLPVIVHPAFLGSYALHPSSGLAPRLLYGRLPRLIGGDISIFPTYGRGFALSRQQDCLAVAEACTGTWGNFPPIFPTAAGRMGEGRIAEMCETFGREFVFILGSQILEHASGVTGACRRFLSSLERIAC
jgi:ribulose-bisphosphate carboxylase large chain